VLEGKQNILFLLHHHLNHLSNQQVLPELQRTLAFVKPYPAGQRLLKLLCRAFTDISLYYDWHKLASGAYGVIYECKTRNWEG